MTTEADSASGKNLWQRLNGPTKIGLVFAAAGILLTIIGILRDPTTPVNAWSLGMGMLISGGTWGVVSWAIATAAVEVERDVAEAECEEESAWPVGFVRWTGLSWWRRPDGGCSFFVAPHRPQAAGRRLGDVVVARFSANVLVGRDPCDDLRYEADG